MFNTPILFLVFNRPDTTVRVFEQIRKIKPAYLYVAADGPRESKPVEKDICDKVRSVVLSQIDWKCEIKTLFRDENLGCGKAVSEAITWFFENVEEGIILEDDCLPDLSFFHYCEVMLNRYRDNKTVMHVGGDNFQFGRRRGKGDYYFSTLGHVWGWATWRRAWIKYQFDVSKAEPIKEQSYKHAFNNNTLFIDYYKDIFCKIANQSIDTWDYQWMYTLIKNDALSICPNVNLVQNIGFGKDATHTSQETEWNRKNISCPLNSFRAPAVLEINYKADEFLLRDIFGLGKYRRRVSVNSIRTILQKIRIILRIK